MEFNSPPEGMKEVMEYIKVKWLHSHPDEPVLLYSELDDNRWETRKVEVFADGSIGFASATEDTSSTNTKLSIVPIPTVEEIASDPPISTGGNHQG
jgi:hypothetical protein